MKKIILLIALVLIAILLTGCGNKVQRVTEEKISMFAVVESTEGWFVVYDADTKVMYLVSKGVYKYGNFCLLVNADGSPKLWEEE